MIMDVRGQHFAVLGLGTSGEAAARLLLAHAALVTLLDVSTAPAVAARAAAFGDRAHAVLGPEAVAAAANASYDVAILSPGIDPRAPLVSAAVARGIPLVGELELGWRFCRLPVAAITGTNGKTTTTELTAAAIAAGGVRAAVCGNIGRPLCDLVLDSEDVEVAVAEVSSFQLESISTFRPKAAAWLNFSADHLDRHGSVEAYRAAKQRIFEYQREEDTAVLNANDAQDPMLGGRAQRSTFSAFGFPADFELHENRVCFHGAQVYDMRRSKFSGLHNAENIMAALAIGRAFGVSFEAMGNALDTCRPSAHRCEPIGEWDAVLYVNDSKSTNPDSLDKALRSQTRPVVLIAGGKDKAMDFTPLAAAVAQRTRAVVVIGELRETLRAAWAQAPCLVEASSLEEAVQCAVDSARPGDVVLLSPGAASFDMFRDYADRGDRFRQIVQKLHTNQHPI